MNKFPAEITTVLEKIDALQESEAREINTEKLATLTEEIELLYKSVPPESKASVVNSLGLAYRRLGERGDISLLKKAIFSFESGIPLVIQHPLTSTLSADVLLVELQNNMSITYIRMFELEKDEKHLDKAEISLNKCVDIANESPFFQESNQQVLKSNIYNNLGNLFKQRYTLSQDVSHGEKSLQQYAIAENFSPEKDQPYFWATIQKNKGEIKYQLSKKTPDDTYTLGAIFDCFESLRYRNRVDAPYQWLKSIEVLFNLILLQPNVLTKELEYREKVSSIIEELSAMHQTLEHKSYEPLKEKYSQVRMALLNLQV